MIELAIALGAGLISFLSPCVLPLIPGYISYISGSSLNELIEKKNINLIPIILFTVGFSIVFIIFGAASTFLGQVLLQNSYELRIVAGLIIIIFSLQILGLINIKFLNYEKRIDTNIKSNMTENAEPGASLRVWKDYFVNANIFGGDIDKNILFEEDRIKTYFVDQLNVSSIKIMWEKTGVEKFDIIIDDGLHEPKANLNFFFNSIHKLKENGIYIIEDVAIII